MFEVSYNGLTIFSKNWLGRFPEKGEVIHLIEEVKAEQFFRVKVFALRVARRSPRFLKKVGKKLFLPLLTRRAVIKP